jgi:hypothetical protein
LEVIFPGLFKDKAKEKAFQYLRDWGDTFFETTEYRVQEVTKKLESQIGASLNASVPNWKSIVCGKKTAQEEERAEIVHRAQEIVHNVQIKALQDLIKFLAEDVFNNDQPRYYILIDRLDEHWVESSVRYRLIRALIETIRDFQRIKCAKIVIALRRDLLERVIRLTRDEGFQEEKYNALLLSLRWSSGQLLSILDRRIDHLIRSRYTTKTVTYKEVLPHKVGKLTIDEYLIQRTLARPRDIIAFFNICLEKSSDRPDISSSILREAEGEHSRARLRSLADEWYGDYPELMTAVENVLKRRSITFRVSTILESEVRTLCLEIASLHCNATTEIATQAMAVYEEKLDPNTFKSFLISVFYRVGLVGLKTETYLPLRYSFDNQLSEAEIRPDTIVTIHPVFCRVLGAFENCEDLRPANSSLGS